ncbi:MAG: GFA family protein [Hyphomicrobiales bacterium]|nr:MAG: GFA family protein [Hyphomicrobiales bacterium]
MNESYSGGCQCGAVRYHVEGPPSGVSICNCRMCQKALGNLTGPFASFKARVAWTRGAPKLFRSSDRVWRGFCADCGTPLTYQWGEGGNPALTIGSFDEPERLLPTVEFARDNRHPIFEHYDAMVVEPLGNTDEERDILAVLRSFQHPDRDTDSWTVGGQ